jgi:uncharacterized protein YndB with AHSA1/START domain
VSVTEHFPVTADQLFGALRDHEGMSRWVGARVSIVGGPTDGSVGTVRRINARGLTFDEEVTYFDPPHRMVYRIVRGVPGLHFHRGELVVEPWGRTGSKVSWDVLMGSWIPGLAPSMAALLGPALQRGLAQLRVQLAT